MGYNVIPPQRLINLGQLDVNFLKINKVFLHLTSKQYTETHSLSSDKFAWEVPFERYDVMRTLWYIIITITMVIVQQQMLKNFRQESMKTAWIRTFLYIRNLFSYSHLEIIIYIYSARGEIDQISTNTLRYTM